jgi:hypothetical protein
LTVSILEAEKLDLSVKVHAFMDGGINSCGEVDVHGAADLMPIIEIIDIVVGYHVFFNAGGWSVSAAPVLGGAFLGLVSFRGFEGRRKEKGHADVKTSWRETSDMDDATEAPALLK